MKNKGLVVGLVVVVVIIFAFVFLGKIGGPKGAIKKPLPGAKALKGAKALAPAKKAFSKDMGGLTVKILNSKNSEAILRAKAFKSIDGRSSVYAASFTSSRMQELAPGNYDIEIDTIPPKLYKNITVSRGKETVEDIGGTGAINVKALNSKGKEAAYPVRVMYPKSAAAIATGATNRPIELLPGNYEIEVGIAPVQIKKEVVIDRNKEAVVDLGCTAGSLLVKAVDEFKKEVRYPVRIKKSGTNEQVATLTTNRPIEILGGIYDIEVLSAPLQSKKEIKVNTREETIVELVVPAPSIPVRAVTPPAKPKK